MSVEERLEELRKRFPNLERPMLTERINYSYVILQQIRIVDTTYLTGDEDSIHLAIQGLHDNIPESWHDQKFREDIEAAKVTRKIDVRPRFCGVPPSEEYCKDNDITVFKEEIGFQYNKMYRACINLLDRLGILMRKQSKNVLL